MDVLIQIATTDIQLLQLIYNCWHTLACRCNGVAAIKHMIVEQLGLAISAPFLLLNLM